MKTTTYLALSLMTSALLLSGCGETSSSDTTNAQNVPLTSGQLVDSYVQNIDYTCGDNTTGVTDINGSFHCDVLPVTFHVGGLHFGTITKIKQDTQVFPQDLVGVTRKDTNNSSVLAMAQFLQSCDDDNNSANGITIKESVKQAFQDRNITFRAEDVQAYATDANIDLVNKSQAHTHLQKTTTFVTHVEEHNEDHNEENKEEGHQDKSSGKIPQTIANALLTPASTLTQATKNTLAYMGNEERLAYDVYTELYNYHLTQGDTITQLINIATKSEATHIATVQLLVEKYVQDLSEFTNVDVTTNFTMANGDLNASKLPTGVYNIQKIQNLHDILITKGQQSKQDALEVGCMVEVTDITDLLKDIEIAKESNATDIVTSFEFLRDGSYSHYWAFDKGLKNMGISDGCCSLGEAYCHTEYPTHKEEDKNNQEHNQNEQGQNHSQNSQAQGQEDDQNEQGQAQGQSHSQNNQAQGQKNNQKD